MIDPVIDRTMAVRIATQLGWEPKREWVDLTAAEIKILRNASNNDREFAALVIAKFKEKNT
jgi:hypothetical protein